MNADTFFLLHPFQFGENCGEHYNEAKTAADNIGDGFGHKNAVFIEIWESFALYNSGCRLK